MGIRRLGFLLSLVMIVFSGAAPAYGQSQVKVPPELEPWVGWVLHDLPDVVCPDVAGTRRCEWPGTLAVDADADGARFEMAVYVDREFEVSLPGDRDRWPQDVRVDGARGVVGVQGDLPVVVLSAGAHRVTGSFRWNEVPQVLTVPPSVGRVELRLGDRGVERPRVDAEGRLWLRDGAGEGLGETEADSVRASVYRKLADGVPLLVTTRVRLNVSGRAREVSLGKILVEGTRPTAVRAAIPLQIGLDGEAKAYVRPGTHDVEIDAVLPTDTAELVAPAPSPNFYDPQEVWVWVPDETVRSVELGGLTAVDPERTSLPDEWKGHTTFLAEPSSKLTLRIMRRGIREEAPNSVNLDREIWLDVDGQGFTIRDRLTGTLNRGWRLNYAPAGGAKLGRVAANGENLLITEQPATGLAGVELRNAALDLSAEVRVTESLGRLAIVGWDHDVQSLTARLHLPPGWTLIRGDGVDTIRGTWVDSWTLWDFFFLLIVALAIGRLFGWPWVLVSILTLGLAHGQQGAPQWIWIQLIVSLALLRVLPDGIWRKAVVVYRAVALVALVVIVAPFAHDQVMSALHPQVSSARAFANFAPEQSPGFARSDDEWQESAPMAPFEQVAAEAEMAQELELASATRKMDVDSLKKGSAWGSGYKEEDANRIQLQQVDPNAIVQTGPGLPDWDWSTWRLEWTGPVRKDHTVALFLVSPQMNLVLGLLRVALLILLGLLLLAPRDMYWGRPRPAPRWWRILGGGALLFAVGATTSFVPREAVAAEPSTTTLDQLRQRLVAQSQCPSPCVVAHEAEVDVRGLELEMTADVSALRDTAWTLPGPADALVITDVIVDGRTSTELRREANGLVQVRLPRGAHSVSLRGTLADRNVVTLQFEELTRPRHLTFAADAWTVDGISPTGVPDNSIQLTRTADSKPDHSESAAAAAELPPWYQVERLVALGLPWQIHTTVRRADSSRPQLVKVPLTAGVKVITEGIRVENGAALVDFGRGETEKRFVGELPVGKEVKLVAAKDEPWTETWTVECSRIWRCSFSELPPTATTSDGVWRPVWRPWPGEQLVVTVERPQGAPGQPKTIDSVRYTVTPGKRLMTAELTLRVRASQGDWQEVTLPEGAELQTVDLNGTTRSIRPENGVVRLPIQPGENTFRLVWQQPWTREMREQVPAVDIGSEAANAHIVMNRGEERLLLAVRSDGISWGPAVLFWPHLVILLILALLLGTLRNLPLGWPEWLLLAIGMSQLPVPAMLPVVAWFAAVSWRGRHPREDWYQFDFVQFALVGLTLLAVGTLYAAVHTNLLIEIDMQVDGMGSSNDQLHWYAERISGSLPTPGIISVPLFAYRVVMFAWALWLAWKLLGWARWGWTNFSSGGRWMRPPRRYGPPQPQTDGNVSPQGKPEEEPEGPPPVERNARDGELVKKEYALGKPPADEEAPLPEEDDSLAEPSAPAVDPYDETGETDVKIARDEEE